MSKVRGAWVRNVPSKDLEKHNLVGEVGDPVLIPRNADAGEPDRQDLVGLYKTVSGEFAFRLKEGSVEPAFQPMMNRMTRGDSHLGTPMQG